MMDAVQPKTPDAVLAGLSQHGASVGARKMMQWEFRHAKTSIQSGLYVTLYNQERQYECSRLGKFSRCFCNHLYAKHKLKKMKSGRFGKNPCQEEGCKCEHFKFMYRRPEEIGQYFLTRRKGFDVTMWRPLCRCKHPHAVHDPVKTRCSECACSKFVGNFACLSCDGKWEEHEVLYEDEDLRRELGKTAREDFYPMADVPEIQAEFLRQIEEEAEKERAKKAAEVKVKDVEGDKDVAAAEEALSQVALVGEESRVVSTMEEREKVTLPARDKPERSVRLMKEQGMLRKY